MYKTIKALLLCAPKTDTRYYINGIHCKGNTMEASDGHIAMIVKDALESDFDFIINREELARLMGIATPKSVIKIVPTSNTAAKIHIDDFISPLNIIDGRFPDVKRVVPGVRSIDKPAIEKGFNNKLAARAFTIMKTAGIENSKFNVCDQGGASILSGGNVTVLLMGCKL